jgi:hypothetical protein
MKLARCLKAVTVTLACLGWLLPVSHAPAAPPPAKAASGPATFHDVRLSPRGDLAGQLLDAAGRPLAAHPIVLVQGAQVLGRTRTDAAGQFVFAQLRGGVYQITNGTVGVACRTWTHQAAPPAAQDRVQLVADAQVVRGQRPISEIFTNPLVIGLIIAAAIAIPLAVHNANQEEPSGS